MVGNDDELSVVREQIARIESVLHGLNRDVRPLNESRFRLLAEPYEDQLADLRRQVDIYVSGAHGRGRTAAAG